jgi:SAM-dependent methyltransferase
VSFFETAYEGSPTWDIGRPQPAVVRLQEADAISGAVLDIGCGTGENAIFLAERGHSVLGVDLVAAAIDRARAKAVERNSTAEFLVFDALRLQELERTFDAVIDIGLFHALQDEERPKYALSLRTALRPGGHCHLLCWSELNEWGFGPRRVSRAEIRSTFATGWRVESIEPEVLASKLRQGEVRAWLATVRRD